MSTIVETLKAKNHFVFVNGVPLMDIYQAQENLQTRFADDYIEYLKAFGVASFEGHELTGLNSSQRLNVVDVTRHERTKNPNVIEGLYVIEEVNIDGIVIWQNADGTVYQTSPSLEPMKLCSSLLEYINM